MLSNKTNFYLLINIERRNNKIGTIIRELFIKDHRIKKLLSLFKVGRRLKWIIESLIFNINSPIEKET